MSELISKPCNGLLNTAPEAREAQAHASTSLPEIWNTGSAAKRRVSVTSTRRNWSQGRSTRYSISRRAG